MVELLPRTQCHSTLPIGYHLKLNGTFEAVAVYVCCLLYVLYLIVQLGDRTQLLQDLLVSIPCMNNHKPSRYELGTFPTLECTSI